MNTCKRFLNARLGVLPLSVLLALCAWAPIATAVTLYNFTWGAVADTWPVTGWANTNYPNTGNNTWPASNGGAGVGSCTNGTGNGTRSSSSTFTNVNASGIDIKVTVSIVNGCFVRSTAGVQDNAGPAGPELRFDANGGTAAGCAAGTSSCPDLGLFVDFTGTAGHTVNVLYQFFATGTTTVSPISLQGFPVRDIDFTSGQYQDLIGLTAVNHTGGGTINPDGISPFTTTPNYTIATPLVTGINTNVGVTDPNGWVSFNFATHLIDSMTLTYSDPASLTNPGQQQVLLGGFVFSTTALATRAVISDVRAYADNGQAWVEWETASEIGTTGFNIYRLDPSTDEFVQLNDRLLPALGGARQGGVYRFPDPNVVPGRQSTYAFEEIEAKGDKHTYGPYAVIAGAGKPVSRKAVERPALSAGNRAPRRDGFEGAAHALDADATGSPMARVAKVAQAATSKPVATKSGTTIRIEVEQEGLYAVTAEKIAAALGVTPVKAQSWISTGQLRLRQRGESIAWRADPGGGRIYFYGQAVDGIDAVYTRYNVYWLDHAPGVTMGTVNASPSSSTPNPLSFASRVHVARQVKPVYWLVTDPDADFWYWDYVETDAGATTFSVPVPDVASSGTATLTIHMLGASDDDRSVHIWLNPSSQNCDLGASPTWHGIALQVFTTAPFSASCLNSDDNTIAVASAASVPGTDSFFWVKGFDVDYPRNFHAVGDQLRLTGAGNPVVNVDGFSGTDIAVLDITDPRGPQWLTGTTVSAASGSGSAVSFAPAANRTYAAALARAPVEVTGEIPTTWKSRTNGANYVVLAPSALRSGADVLAAYRDATVVELQDIYDEFNFGIANPHAVQDFFAYANKSWKPAPRFAALVGKGTIDPKDYMGYGGNLFPVLMVDTPSGLYNSDNQYADFNDDGVPDIAIGRIPAVTAADVTNYVAKLAAHERARGSTSQALLVADNPDPDAGDFTVDSLAVAQALKANNVATTALNRAALPSGSALRARLIGSLNSSAGVGLFNYVGHGAFSQLGYDIGDPLFTNDDVSLLTNGPRLPIFTAFTCEVGDGTYPGTNSLTEMLLWRQGGGAVAAFVPNALSEDHRAHALNLTLMKALTGSRSSATLGEAAVAALREFANKGGQRYILDIYQVVGDPALRLRR